MHRFSKYAIGVLLPVLAVLIGVALAGCGSTHTPKPVLTTQAEKNAAHKGEKDGVACLQKDHLRAIASHSGRELLATCMGLHGKVKADLVTCLENQALNAGSLLHAKNAVISCFTQAELASS